MIFTKLQSTGNDFLILNCFDDITKTDGELASKVCDRHFGIGADGLALILYSDDADIKVEFYNADGVKTLCNTNLLRCVAKYSIDNKIVNKRTISVETDGGIKYVQTSDEGLYTVNIGEPVFTPQLIPVDYSDGDFIEKNISVGAEDYTVSCVSVNSNPCAVIFVETTEELNDFEINRIGPLLEKHHYFPDNMNIVIANIKDYTSIQARCWQINTGETIGCDFGAVAAFVIAESLGKVDTKITCELLGGDINIQISEDNFAYTSAKAENVFEINW